MPQYAIHKLQKPRNIKTAHLGLCWKSGNFITQLRCQPFVSVQMKLPSIANWSIIYRPIPLIAIVFKGMMQYPRTRLFGQRHCVIRTA